MLSIFTSGQDVILRLAGFYFVLSGLPSSIDGFSGQKLHSDDEEACLNFQQPNICFSCQAFLNHFSCFSQHDVDADSSDLPQVIRCSADRMSENGVYLLGEFILNQVLHDHHFCGRVKSIV